jgi:hypothetical protein
MFIIKMLVPRITAEALAQINSTVPHMDAFDLPLIDTAEKAANYINPNRLAAALKPFEYMEGINRVYFEPREGAWVVEVLCSGESGDSKYPHIPLSEINTAPVFENEVSDSDTAAVGTEKLNPLGRFRMLTVADADGSVTLFFKDEKVVRDVDEEDEASGYRQGLLNLGYEVLVGEVKVTEDWWDDFQYDSTLEWIEQNLKDEGINVNWEKAPQPPVSTVPVYEYAVVQNGNDDLIYVNGKFRTAFLEEPDGAEAFMEAMSDAGKAGVSTRLSRPLALGMEHYTSTRFQDLNEMLAECSRVGIEAFSVDRTVDKMW